MKNSGLQNRFPENIKYLWMFWYKCFWCGENNWDCLHHIISPSSYGFKRGKHNLSAINSCPIHNFGCHLDNGKLHNNKYEVKLLNKVIQYLISVNYKFNSTDKEFFKQYYDTHFSKIYHNGNRPWS